MTFFLTLDIVHQIHQRMVTEFGGDPGVRDEGLAASAVAMPAQAFGGELLHRDVPSQTAAYLFHICRNHPFVDGNKRTALAAAELFVLLNGHVLKATNEELVELTLGVAEGTLTKEAVTDFFSRHIG